MRIQTIDCLRGIAALGVCLFHFCHLTVNVHFLGDDNLLKSIARFGTLGVQLFFVISGFVLPYSMANNNYGIRSFPLFIARRSVRIDLPYFFVVILSAGYFYFINNYGGEYSNFNYRQFALHFIYLPTFFNYKWYLGVFWTLLIEFQFYILIALLLPVLQKSPKAISILLLIAIQFFHFLYPDKRLITSHISFFIMGISAFLYKTEVLKLKETLLLVLLSLVFSYLHGMSFYNHPIAMSIVGLLSFAVLTFVEIKNRLLLWLGKISYSFYLTHMLVAYVLFSNSFWNNFSQNEWVRTFMTVSGVLLSIVIAYIFYLVIERVSLKLAQKITYNP